MSNDRHFMDMLRAQCQRGKFLGVGLDSSFMAIPEEFKEASGYDIFRTTVAFNTNRVWQTLDCACAYMADHNFYLSSGVEGLRALEQTIRSVRAIAPGVPFILGSYAGGVYHSNVDLARYAFDQLGVDAIVINPWFGQEAFEPLLRRAEKGILVTCRTSNEGAEDFQELLIAKHDDVRVFQTVAHRVATWWNKQNHNCGLLMGPMGYGELGKVRELAGHLPIFVTGIGTRGQNGKIEESDVQEIIANGSSGEAFGVVLCSSRGIIFAPGPRGPHDEAVRLHNLIHKYRAFRQAVAVGS